MATGLPANRSDANNEWVLDFSNFRTAWAKSRGAGITIAHPDTGWTLHPELVAPTYRRDLSRNFYEPIKHAWLGRPEDTWPTSDNLHGFMSSAHGTATAGVLVSPTGRPDGSPTRATDAFPSGSTAAFVSGAAPDATVIPFRVTNNPLMMDDEDSALAKCIYHCIGLKANRGIEVAVMSISLGGTRFGTESKIKNALVQARFHGIVMIAAAGQVPGQRTWFGRHMATDQWYPTFPGSSPETICVAGCDYRHAPLELGFYGKEVDISAPAVNVWIPRTKPGKGSTETHRVEQSHGTSYATALTAASCALWQSHHGRDRLIDRYGRSKLLTVFKYCLQESAHRPAGWDTTKRGAGVLDVTHLLDLPLPSDLLVDELFFKKED